MLTLTGVLALGVWYLLRHLDEFKRIVEIDAFSFTALVLLSTLAIWLSGLTLNAVLPIFDVRLSLWEGFGLSAVNTMANFYFTKAGLAAKGLYLKKLHNLPYTHYVSILAGTTVVSLTTQGMVGLGSYAVFLRESEFRVEVLIAFLALTVVGLIPLLLPRLHVKSKRELFTKLQRAIDGWEEIKLHRKTIVVLALLNVAYIIVGALRLYVSYRALGYVVGFLECLVIAPISTLTMLLSLTPGAIGFRQALVGYASELLGIGMAEGVVAATIDHAVGTLCVFVFGLIFSNWIFARKLRVKRVTEGEVRP